MKSTKVLDEDAPRDTIDREVMDSQGKNIVLRPCNPRCRQYAAGGEVRIRGDPVEKSLRYALVVAIPGDVLQTP